MGRERLGIILWGLLIQLEQLLNRHVERPCDLECAEDERPSGRSRLCRLPGMGMGSGLHFWYLPRLSSPPADIADCRVVHAQEPTDLSERVLVDSCGEIDHLIASLLVVSIREEDFETWPSSH